MCPSCFQETYSAQGCASCGYVKDQDNDGRGVLPAFTTLHERYLIGRVLGSGGFGITYKAYDIYNNQLCAVKEFMPNGIACRAADRITVQLNMQEDLPVFQHAEKRFTEEAMILMQLRNIHAIVDVTDYFYANSTAYFVMPFLDGCHLKELYRRMNKKIPVDMALKIISRIAESLMIVHEKGKLLHRDISPENIMIDHAGEAYLIDFGNARSYISEKSQNMSVLLKPGYAPPEQYSSRGKQGPWTDVYALASTFYFVTAGVTVPDAPDRLQGHACPLLDTLVPECPHGLAEVIDRALCVNLNHRIQSMRELLEALKPYLQQSQTAQPPQQPAQRQTAQPEQKAAVTKKPAGPYLEVISGEQRGNRWMLIPDLELKVGSSTQISNVVLAKYAKVSGVHCLVRYDSGKNLFFLQDVSETGTKVNGTALQSQYVYQNPPGQKISLAADSCVFLLGLEP